MAKCPKGHECLSPNWCGRCRNEIYAERQKACDHVDKGTRFEEGVLGGTYRTRCAWCNELLHDTLWDIDFEDD